MTLGKRGDLHARRADLAKTRDRGTATKLIDVLGPALRRAAGRLCARPQGRLPLWRRRADGGDRVRRARCRSQGSGFRAAARPRARRTPPRRPDAAPPTRRSGTGGSRSARPGRCMAGAACRMRRVLAFAARDVGVRLLARCGAAGPGRCGRAGAAVAQRDHALLRAGRAQGGARGGQHLHPEAGAPGGAEPVRGRPVLPLLLPAVRRPRAAAASRRTRWARA